MTVIIDGTTGIQVPDGSGSVPSYSNDGDGNTGLFFPAADTVAFATSGSERLRIDSAGNAGLGVTPSAGNAGLNALQIGAVNGLYLLGGAGVAQIGSNYYFSGGYKYGATGAATNYETEGGTHKWYTAASGTAGNTISFTQAMTLDASGNLGIGTTSPNFSGQTSSVRVLSLQGASNYSGVEVATGASDGADNLLGFYGFAYPTNSVTYRLPAYIGAWSEGATANQRGANLRFFTQANATAGATERARITSAGEFCWNKTAAGSTTTGIDFELDGATTARLCIGGSNSTSATALSIYSTGAGAFRFYVSYGGTVYATNTTISAISDQRLKENVRDLDVGLDAVLALKPRKFDWKPGKGADVKNARGFIAQEFEQVFPDLVTDWLDPAPEGEEPYKSVRQDLIPVLVKAIQELKAELDATKAKVAALEGK